MNKGWTGSHRAREGRPQRPVPMRQRQKIQALLPGQGRASPDSAAAEGPDTHCVARRQAELQALFLAARETRRRQVGRGDSAVWRNRPARPDASAGALRSRRRYVCALAG